MSEHKFKSARAVAVEVLDRCDPKKSFASAVLDKVQHQTDQRQRATDLVFGTLRNRTAIDTVITTFSGRPVKRIQAGLLNIIRVGTYELLYCPSTEQYAIVNEAVLNCRGGSRNALRWMAKPSTDKQAGFVNAVLRQIARHISNRRIPLSQADPERTLPQTTATCCQFDTSFLPDCHTCPAEYLSTVFSLPEWLVAGWLADPCFRSTVRRPAEDDVTPAKAGGGEESARRICLASNRRPSVYLRPNRLKTTTDALAKKIAAAEVGYEIVPEADMIRIKSPRDVTQLPGFSAGEFTVQDVTASMPVRMLSKSTGGSRTAPTLKLLDLCAAPGTKTTQLAEATGEKAKIIATDIDARRLEMVKENVARLGIKSVDVVPYKELLNCKGGSRTAPTAYSKFDCVLVDVPCSNTGVLAKRIEVRYRIEPEKIEKLARTQMELLEIAAKMTAPGGKICYSTCSIQRKENTEIIENFLKKNKNFTLVSQQLTLPEAEGFDHDGGYAAILVKRKDHDS